MDKIEGLFVVVIEWGPDYSDVYGPYRYDEAVESWAMHNNNLSKDQTVKVKLAKLTFLD